MAKNLYFATHGTDDPTRAAFPFFLARGAAEGGHEPHLALAMDGVLLMKDTIAQSIQPVGLPSFEGLINSVVGHRVPILV